MVTGVPLAAVSGNIALFTKTNGNSLASSLVKLASGKRINNPSDGIPDYFYSEQLKSNSRSAGNVLKSIVDAQAFTDVAANVGESVFNAITDMRELVKQYYKPNVTTDEQTALAAEFNSLKVTVTTIMQSSTYDGMTVVSDNGGTPFKSVALDEKRPAQVLTVSYGNEDIADLSALTIGVAGEAAELDLVDTERGKAGSYLAKTSAYERGLNAHYSLVANKIKTENGNAERITEVSTGDEYIKAMNQSIRNQSSLAMLAQSNMYRMSITRLFG